MSVDDPVIPSFATTAGDTEAHSSNMGKEEDKDRMDLASDLDATANALQLADSNSATVCSGVSQKLSKNKKGKSPYLPKLALPPSVSIYHP